jgi:hypothetical protein
VEWKEEGRIAGNIGVVTDRRRWLGWSISFSFSVDFRCRAEAGRCVGGAREMM